MNLLIISGRLGQDADTRYTQAGKAVCSFSVAVDSGWGDNKSTSWFRCALFGKRAEGGLVPYLTKGTFVTVTGEVSLDEYEAKGEKRASLKVFVKDVELGPKAEAQAQQPKDHVEPKDDFHDDLNDLPF